MRTILKLALLTAALFTVACTEDPDAVTDSDIAAAADEPTDLAINGDVDTLQQRQVDTAAQIPGGDRLATPNAPRGETQPGSPGTGVLECRTGLRPAHADEPAMDTVATSSTELSLKARTRYQRLHRLHRHPTK